MRPRCTVSHTKSDIFEDNILADMASHMVRGVSQGMQNCLDAYSTDPPTTTRRPELGAGNGRGIGAGDDQEESVETHGHALLAAFALEESGAYQLPQKRVSGVSGLSPWRRSANPIICLGVLPRHGKNFWGRWWPRGPRPANPPSRYELVRNTMVDSNLRHIPHSCVHQEERAAIPPALARDMLGIPTYDQGSVAAGAHVVARTFLSGLAAELH